MRVSSHVPPIPPLPAATRPRVANPASGARPSPAGAGLWDLLTLEEQEFFTRETALGPLTYGPPRAGGGGAPVGGRIDVKG